MAAKGTTHRSSEGKSSTCTIRRGSSKTYRPTSARMGRTSFARVRKTNNCAAAAAGVYDPEDRLFIYFTSGYAPAPLLRLDWKSPRTQSPILVGAAADIA
jgi:hypothetical protein